MKRKLFLITIFTAITLSSVAQTIGEAFYVYRNDGQFNAFLRDDIESIEYSYEDANGKTYNEIVTQIINTKDNTYKIPLAVIDSVAFVTPQTIINNDVFMLTEIHSPYISDADTLHFTMVKTTPEQYRPKIGNIVVSTAECLAFPDGIIAKIESIKSIDTGYRYECSLASIDDVFEQLVVFANQLDGTDSENQISAFDLRRATIPDKTLWEKKWSKTIGGDNASATFEVGTKASITATIRKTLTTPLYFQIQLQNELETSVEFAANKYIGRYIREQIGNTVTAGRISIPYTGGALWLSPKLSLYCYFQGEGNIDLKYKGIINRTDKAIFTYSEGKWQFGHVPTNDIGTDVASLSMNGYTEIGLMPQIDFSLNGRKAGFGMSASIGLKEYGNFLLDMTKLSDGGVYEAMLDSYCRTTIPWSATFHGSIDIFSKYDSDVADIGSGTISYTYEPPEEPQWGEIRYLFPLFRNVNYVKTPGSSAKYLTSAGIERTPLFPIQLGFSLIDKNNEIVSREYDTRTLSTSDLFTGYNLAITPPNQNEKYVIRPCLKLFGYDILASPEAEQRLLCPDENHPHMIDMGLPSGTKWACCNVGASKPEEYGNHYYWAQAKNMATPSKAQMEELVDNTDFVWSTGGYMWGEYNGVKGALFVSKVNGARIFLPAAGHYDRSGNYDNSNTAGRYYSKDYAGFDDYFGLDQAIALYFWDYYKSSGDRMRGFGVDPVKLYPNNRYSVRCVSK